MEQKRVEFWNTPEGKVHYRVEGSEREIVFSQEDSDIIEFVIETVKKYFPLAYKRLEEKNVSSSKNYSWHRYRIADDFIRCNFGQRDQLHYDLDHELFSFEEVVCPLRGVCKDEGVICKPQIRTILGNEEYKVAVAYTKGFSREEIAELTGKSPKTVANQLNDVMHKFGLKKLPAIRKIMNCMNIRL